MMPVCLYLYQLGTCEALHAVMRHAFDTGFPVPELRDFIVLSLERESVPARDSCKRQFALSSRESRLQETVCLVFERESAPARDSRLRRPATDRRQVSSSPAGCSGPAGFVDLSREREHRAVWVAAQLAHPAEVVFQVVWLISLIKAAA